jgi:hypothetical protein
MISMNERQLDGKIERPEQKPNAQQRNYAQKVVQCLSGMSGGMKRSPLQIAAHSRNQRSLIYDRSVVDSCTRHTVLTDASA